MPSVFGQSVTFTATVSVVSPGSGTPTGSVTFYYGSIVIGSGTLSGGTASCSSTTLPVGADVITATYSGDSNFNGSTSPNYTQTVNKADTSTSLSSNPNPSVFGQSVTFTATVSVVSPGSGTPTGTVVFYYGSIVIGSDPLSGGTATCSYDRLPVGSDTITAVYGGDGNFNGSTSADYTQTVNKDNTTTTLSSSLNPSAYGQSVTFTAAVSVVSPGTATPTGTVTFLDGGAALGTEDLNSQGVATFTTSSLTIGAHTITAQYNGDSNCNGSTSDPLTQTVNKAATTTTVTSNINPSVLTQPVTFTATVTPSSQGPTAPTGTVTFYDGNTNLGTATLGNGPLSITTANLVLGDQTITAVYSGDSNYGGSQGTMDQTVQSDQIATTTTLTSSANPSVFGQSVTFTATEKPNPSAGGNSGGTVTFTDGSTTLGTIDLNSQGIATFTTATLAVASHTITATYNGNQYYLGSYASLTQVVNQDGTTTTVSSSVNPSVYGQMVTFTATVAAASPGSGTPTGTVTFTDGGTTLGTGNLNSAGQATWTTTSPLSVDTHTITATYNGDTNFTTSYGTLSQVVKQASTTTTLSSDDNPLRTGG